MQENTFSKAGNVLFGSNALTIRVSTSHNMFDNSNSDVHVWGKSTSM